MIEEGQSSRALRLRQSSISSPGCKVLLSPSARLAARFHFTYTRPGAWKSWTGCSGLVETFAVVNCAAPRFVGRISWAVVWTMLTFEAPTFGGRISRSPRSGVPTFAERGSCAPRLPEPTFVARALEPASRFAIWRGHTWHAPISGARERTPFSRTQHPEAIQPSPMHSNAAHFKLRG